MLEITVKDRQGPFAYIYVHSYIYVAIALHAYYGYNGNLDFLATPYHH